MALDRNLCVNRAVMSRIPHLRNGSGRSHYQKAEALFLRTVVKMPAKNNAQCSRQHGTKNVSCCHYDYIMM